MARPRNQQARREHLIRAARRAIVRYGLARVRVRDVAESAGMATGSVTYYFPEIDDLFQEVFTDAVDRFCAMRREAADATADPHERLAVTIRSGLPSGPDDELCALLYEFAPNARRRRTDALLRRSLYERQVDLYRYQLEAGAALGAFHLRSPAAQIAANLVALEDAYGYHVVTRTSMTRDQAITHLLGYASLATGVHLT